MDELLTILHCHLLPEDNCLLKKYYAMRSLTKKLGLAYNIIHACERGCVLFRGEHAYAMKCPKCSCLCYKYETRKNSWLKN